MKHAYSISTAESHDDMLLSRYKGRIYQTPDKIWRNNNIEHLKRKLWSTLNSLVNSHFDDGNKSSERVYDSPTSEKKYKLINGYT